MEEDRAIEAALAGTGIGDYAVRTSARARRVSLKISAAKGLEIVVPRGFDPRGIPALILAKHRWLRRHALHLRQQHEAVAAENRVPLPPRVRLGALGECYEVSYAEGGRLRVVAERARLRVMGGQGQVEARQGALQSWLRGRARQALVPWLERVSAETGLPFSRVSIRRQRTRWASCSSRGDISLNCKLLFLTADQVHYILVHELCHTRHLDHSGRFWVLVGDKLPDYRRLDREIRGAWGQVPQWADA